MYLEFFGLQKPPFSLSPDTAFYYQQGQFREALNTLLVALRCGEGFIKVTGEVGTGKTILCRKLLNTLDERFVSAYIPNPYLTPNALSLALAEELGLELPRNSGLHRIMKGLTERLIALNEGGRQVVLLIDEAQAVPDETLEALRLLTNLETEQRKLLQVVLFGQPELDQRLARPRVRQLRQRITFSHRLRPLSRPALADYLAHRLQIAGSESRVVFEPAAIRALHRFSRGIPRLANVLAHKAFMLCFGQGVRRVTPRHIRLAAADTEDCQASAPRSPWLWVGLSATAFAAAVLLFSVGVLA